MGKGGDFTATYVTSDLHGLELKNLKRLLDKAGFNDNDWLYILGDVIDRRNDGGVEVLRWLLSKPNVQLIMGNHEAMLLACGFVFDKITEDSIEKFTPEKTKLLINYIKNGGDVTLSALKQLMKTSPETVEDILDYLRDAPLYEAVTVGDNDFLLVHSGLDNFNENKKLSAYSAEDFIWATPQINQNYYEGITTVFGHTPTFAYGEEYRGKILHTETWIDIDVGVPYGNSPALLRLDNLKEIYL